MNEKVIAILADKTWHSADDVCGVDGVDCIVTNGIDIGYISFYGDSGPTLYSQQKPFGKITHWMPLPNLPKEKT